MIARERRVAQVRRALGHRIEHRLHVGRRVRDDAQDLADRGLLLERVGELAGALLDLALEARVRLAQLRRHAVEALGEALRARRRCAPRSSGRGSPSPMRCAPSDSVRIGRTMPRASASAPSAEITRPASSSKPGAQDRRVELRVDLRHRLLDEHASSRATRSAPSTPAPACRRGRATSSPASAGSPCRRPPARARAARGWSCAARGRCPGSATRKPLRSTTYAFPFSPILIRDTTSQMNLRLTSAMVTGPVSAPERMPIVMYGSVSLRKYTGPTHGCAALRVARTRARASGRGRT